MSPADLRVYFPIILHITMLIILLVIAAVTSKSNIIITIIQLFQYISGISLFTSIILMIIKH